MKKSISFFLCLMLLAGLVAVPAYAQEGLSNFQKTQSYPSGLFTDVTAGDWFALGVSAAYEYGLVQGMAANRFGVDENLKLSDVVALAARLHSIYTSGSATFTQGEPWHQVYVDYAVAKGIINKGGIANYEAYATRYQVAGILAKALPVSALSAINSIGAGDIPDVSLEIPYESIYRLYNAGVLTGKTADGSFKPFENIRRSEIAAIVTRMAIPSLRVKFTLEKADPNKITTAEELKTAVTESQKWAELALSSFNNAYLAAASAASGGGTADALLAVALLNQAIENIEKVSPRALAAADFTKGNAAYAALSTDLTSAYDSAIKATAEVKAVSKAPMAVSYKPGQALLEDTVTALKRAAAAIG